MTGERLVDEWSSGDAYEAYVGRWSRAVGRRFVGWLGAGPGLRWLDVGCGAGALTTAVVEVAEAAEVLGIDPSAAYVSDAWIRLGDRRVRFEVADAMSLGITARCDVAVSGLVLNFLPDPRSAVEAMDRAVVPGGIVAAYVWDYAGRMELMRYFWDTAGRLDESARDVDEGVRFPRCHPEQLTALWEEAGAVPASPRQPFLVTV